MITKLKMEKCPEGACVPEGSVETSPSGIFAMFLVLNQGAGAMSSSVRPPEGARIQPHAQGTWNHCTALRAVVIRGMGTIS